MSLNRELRPASACSGRITEKDHAPHRRGDPALLLLLVLALTAGLSGTLSLRWVITTTQRAADSGRDAQLHQQLRTALVEAELARHETLVDNRLDAREHLRSGLVELRRALSDLVMSDDPEHHDDFSRLERSVDAYVLGVESAASAQLAADSDLDARARELLVYLERMSDEHEQQAAADADRAQRVLSLLERGYLLAFASIAAVSLAAAFGSAGRRREIEQSRQLLAAQRDELAAYAAAVESTDDSVIVTSPDGSISLWNRGASDLYGYAAEEVLGKHVGLVMSEEERERLGSTLGAALAGESVKMISRDVRKDGSHVSTAVTVSPVFGDDGSVTAVVGIARDISDQERARELERDRERQLEHLAFHDPLTGLANRALLNDRLAHALASRRGSRVALLLLDLDDFKTVNDVSGHGAGDQLLVEVSRRLLRCVRFDDTVARLGGDEFAILVEDSDAQQVAQRALEELARPILVDGREIVSSASFGIADSDGIADPGTLLLRADVAMYTAKRAGKGRAAVFSDDMAEALRERADQGEALRNAVTRNEIVVHYQPIIDVEAGTASRLEALVRWKRSNGLVAPGGFLPLAEESGLIVDIGEAVLRQALGALGGWLEEDGRRSVAVNVSALQLNAGTFPDTVRRLLEGSGLRGSQLVLEVTETLFLDPSYGFVDQLVELRQLGIRVSIDDFGTGYSSLGRLQTLPVDSLKIDKSFIDPITLGDEDLPILRSMILMAHSLGLDVTAEGVETRVQAERLTGLGCDYLQGYYFSRPVEVEEATQRASIEATTRFGEVVGVDTTGAVVLVVEDDAAIRVIVRAILTAAGFDVEEAIAGGEAISLARELKPDCIVVDLGLPDMDGLDVVRALRSEPTLHTTAIVVLTGAAHRDVKSAAFAAGADDYIVKPVTPQHLPARVRGAIKSGRASSRNGTGHR